MVQISSELMNFRWPGQSRGDSYSRLRAGHGKLVSRVMRRLPAFRRGPAILMYHRVTQPLVDPWDLCVTPARFAEHLDVLSRHRRVLALDDFVERHRQGTLPEDAVAITFDDGYLDILVEALPLLRRHGAPATVFLATGVVGQDHEFWPDELARLVLGGTLGSAVELDLCGQRFRFEAGPGGDASRRRVHLALWRLLRDAAPDARAASLETLRRGFSGTGAGRGAFDRTMNGEEVRRLVADGLVRIGGHSVSHAVLPELPPVEREREIAGSRDACLALSDASSRCFSYPFGDLDGPTRDLVQRLGFLGAVTTEMRPVRRGDDRFALPRLHIKDWDGDGFARTLGMRGARRH